MQILKISLLITIFPFTFFAQWDWQNGFPPRQNILKIKYINDDTLFAVGEKGLIMRSTNGGLNWTHQTSNTETTLNDIIFTNDEQGFIAGNTGMVLKTTDSGLHWIKKGELLKARDLFTRFLKHRPSDWINKELKKLQILLKENYER